MSRLILILLALTAALPSWAAECRFLGTVCVDSASSKTFNGTVVTMAQAGVSCWEYRDNYECLEPSTTNYCDALSKTDTCLISRSECALTAWTGECIKTTEYYRCGNAELMTPANTTRLDNTYTVTASSNRTQCDPLASSNRCTPAGRVCTQPAETRVIDGVSVYQDCWEYREDYTCISDAMSNDCQDMNKTGCTLTNTDCIADDPILGCTTKANTYQCVIKQAETKTAQDCSAKTMCANGECWDTGAPADTDFAKALATQEAMREAGTYMKDSRLFSGVSEACSKGFGGAKNCCKTSGGAQTNNSVVMGLLGSGAMDVGKEAVNAGSRFVYDTAFSMTGWTGAGMACVNPNVFDTFLSGSGTIGNVFGLSLGGTGLTGAGLMGASTEIASFGGYGLYFNPYSFAIAVAIQVVMEMMQCEPEEKEVGMHVGANLCHYVGSYPSKQLFGVTIEIKQSYCCFNSKLARIINEQGRPQIGRDWGTPESPNCAGFTTEEFAQVDFSKLDLTEFLEDVKANTTLPSATTVNNVSTTAQKKVVQ